MSRTETMSTEITVVGSGVAGLMTARTLAKDGYGVTLVEKAPKLASGATTKNEGWLHAGTYHSVAIQDEEQARQVTARTRYGHDFILGYAPHAVENPSEESYAVFQSEAFAAQAEDRWKEMEIERKQLSLGAFQQAVPTADIKKIQAAFAVGDKSINTWALCKKLLGEIEKYGGKVFVNTTLSPIDDRHAELRDNSNDTTTPLRSDLFIITAGAGIKDFFENYTGQPFPMRYMKSHLLVMPRLMQSNVFFMENGEAGVMYHGNNSIVGINRDGIPMTVPDTTVVKEKETLLFDAVSRLVPGASDVRSYHAVACVKPDVYKRVNDTMNLNVTIDEPAPNYLFAVPGKMTESPYLAAQVATIAQRRLSTRDMVQQVAMAMHTPGSSQAEISLRPCDLYSLQTGFQLPA